ncbi:MAG: hypothetical protein AAF846_11150 [Chloroflexota bacterium]
MIEGTLLILVTAFIGACFMASFGKGHQYEALYFLLVVIFGNPTMDQLIVITIIAGVCIFTNEIYRSAKS